MRAALVSPDLVSCLPQATCRPATGLGFSSHERQFALPAAERASPKEAQKLSRNVETDACVHFSSGFSFKFLLCGFRVLGTAMNTLVSRTCVGPCKAGSLI